VELKNIGPSLVVAYLMDKLTMEFCTVRVSKEMYLRFSGFIPGKLKKSLNLQDPGKKDGYV
jgi:hypothetical protein